LHGLPDTPAPALSLIQAAQPHGLLPRTVHKTASTGWHRQKQLCGVALAIPFRALLEEPYTVVLCLSTLFLVRYERLSAVACLSFDPCYSVADRQNITRPVAHCQQSISGHYPSLQTPLYRGASRGLTEQGASWQSKQAERTRKARFTVSATQCRGYVAGEAGRSVQRVFVDMSQTVRSV
jgi:hypothetical protein